MGSSEIQNEIPLMWGLNGVMTVVGSVAAVMISMLVGFDLTILGGGGIYIFLAFVPMVLQ
jgi:hypothetical protein